MTPSTWTLEPSAPRTLLKASQLALDNLDLHLIEHVPHLLYRNFVFNGDLLGHSAGNLPLPGRALELGGNLILFQCSILLYALEMK